MNERKDEKWLDEQLRRAIDAAAPQFDARAWKERFAAEYQELKARGERVARSPASNGSGDRVTPICRVDRFARRVAEAPWQMVTTVSLLAAFMRGGEEALDRQLDMALEVLGPWPDDSSTRHLFDDLERWYLEGV